MAARRTVTLYVVQRLGWEYNDEWYDRPDPQLLAEYGAEADLLDTPVQTFLTRAAAEAAARRLDARERGDVNPFDYGGDGTQLGAYSSLTPAQFRDRLAAAGLTPPPMNRVGRVQGGSLWEWWEENSGDMTPEQRDAVVGALDRARFFDVTTVEVPLTGSPGKGPACLYAVEKVTWGVAGYDEIELPAGQKLPPGYRLNPFKPDRAVVEVLTRDPAGGGQVLQVFAAREKAAEHAAKLEEKARARANPFRHGTRVAEWTSLDADRLHDWVVDLGLTPPPHKGKGTHAARWRVWWDEHAPELTAVQRERMWKALDRVRFHQVIELRPDEPAPDQG